MSSLGQILQTITGKVDIGTEIDFLTTHPELYNLYFRPCDSTDLVDLEKLPSFKESNIAKMLGERLNIDSETLEKRIHGTNWTITKNEKKRQEIKNKELRPVKPKKPPVLVKPSSNGKPIIKYGKLYTLKQAAKLAGWREVVKAQQYILEQPEEELANYITAPNGVPYLIIDKEREAIEYLAQLHTQYKKETKKTQLSKISKPKKKGTPVRKRKDNTLFHHVRKVGGRVKQDYKYDGIKKHVEELAPYCTMEKDDPEIRLNINKNELDTLIAKLLVQDILVSGAKAKLLKKEWGFADKDTINSDVMLVGGHKKSDFKAQEVLKHPDKLKPFYNLQTGELLDGASKNKARKAVADILVTNNLVIDDTARSLIDKYELTNTHIKPKRERKRLTQPEKYKTKRGPPTNEYESKHDITQGMPMKSAHRPDKRHGRARTKRLKDTYTGSWESTKEHPLISSTLQLLFDISPMEALLHFDKITQYVQGHREKRTAEDATEETIQKATEVESRFHTDKIYIDIKDGADIKTLTPSSVHYSLHESNSTPMNQVRPLLKTLDELDLYNPKTKVLQPIIQEYK